MLRFRSPSSILPVRRPWKFAVLVAAATLVTMPGFAVAQQVVDDFTSGPSTISACGNSEFRYHESPTILGGARETRARDGHSCALGGRSHLDIVVTGAGYADFYGATAVEGTIQYGTAIGTVDEPWSLSPNKNKGVPLNLALAATDQLQFDMLDIYEPEPYFWIELVAGNGQRYTKFVNPISVGSNLVSLADVPASVLADVDGIILRVGNSTGNTAGSGHRFDKISIVPSAETFFTDTLATDSTSPNVSIPAGKYSKTASGLERTQNSTGGGNASSNTDRPVVKTKVNTYLTQTQFTAEVTVNLTSPDLAYFGFGQGTPDPNYFEEPSRAFAFRVHNNWGWGHFGIQAFPTQFGSSVNSPDHFFNFVSGGGVGNYAGGALTLRIERNGDSLTMSIPSMGTSRTFSISQFAAAMGLTNSNTVIFFGNTNVGSVFSDLTIYETLPDTTAPVITAPGDITAEATSASGAAVNFAATATDDVDGSVPVTANPASGSTFPIGNTTVDLSANDAAGNTATASFTVTVQDTIAPIVTAPGNVVAEATSDAGAVVSYPAPTATDAVGVTSIVSNPPSGGIFPLGDTTVTATARDAAGNTGGASFTVSVVDTTAPALTVPATQTLEATSAAGAAASFSASATDAVGVVSLAYSEASGSTFPIGTTTVTVTATDAAGNQSSGSFTVTVHDTTAPAIASVTPSKATLWSPNHQMVAISVDAVATDAVGVASLKIISVTSSEPDNGLGDGDTAGDIVITGPLSVNLRAERAGKGNGRTYTITVEARDAAGNASAKICTVLVPKSQGGR